MADSALEKIKEQYLETIVHAMPITQAAFLILMSVILDRMLEKHGVSTIEALSGVTLGKMFDKDEGYFWSTPIIAIIASFFLSMCNIAMINFFVRKSFFKSKVEIKLNVWRIQARNAMTGITPEQANLMQTSLQSELEKRQKKFRIRRMCVELVFSIALSICYGAVFTVQQNIGSISSLRIAYYDLIVFAIASITCFMLHRSSVRYALSKVIPVQVFIGATTSNLIFIDGID